MTERSPRSDSDRANLGRRLGLVVITDEALVQPRSLVHVLGQALDGGAPAVQLRSKSSSARELFDLARKLLPMVRAAGALFIVNDRLDVALAAGADGVHLGPDDLPVRGVRQAVADEFIIGCSVDTVEDAAQAEADGADYVGVGTVYRTANKSDAGDVIGLPGLERVVRGVHIPVVGIGGITPERAHDVARAGACGAAVIGAVMSAEDPAGAVRALLSAFD